MGLSRRAVAVLLCVITTLGVIGFEVPASAQDPTPSEEPSPTQEPSPSEAPPSEEASAQPSPTEGEASDSPSPAEETQPQTEYIPAPQVDEGYGDSTGSGGDSAETPPSSSEASPTDSPPPSERPLWALACEEALADPTLSVQEADASASASYPSLSFQQADVAASASSIVAVTALVERVAAEETELPALAVQDASGFSPDGGWALLDAGSERVEPLCYRGVDVVSNTLTEVTRVMALFHPVDAPVHEIPDPCEEDPWLCDPTTDDPCARNPELCAPALFELCARDPESCLPGAQDGNDSGGEPSPSDSETPTPSPSETASDPGNSDVVDPLQAIAESVESPQPEDVVDGIEGASGEDPASTTTCATCVVEDLAECVVSGGCGVDPGCVPFVTCGGEIPNPCEQDPDCVPDIGCINLVCGDPPDPCEGDPECLPDINCPNLVCGGDPPDPGCIPFVTCGEPIPDPCENFDCNPDPCAKINCDPTPPPIPDPCAGNVPKPVLCDPLPEPCNPDGGGIDCTLIDNPNPCTNGMLDCDIPQPCNPDAGGVDCQQKIDDLLATIDDVCSDGSDGTSGTDECVGMITDLLELLRWELCNYDDWVTCINRRAGETAQPVWALYQFVMDTITDLNVCTSSPDPLIVTCAGQQVYPLPSPSPPPDPCATDVPVPGVCDPLPTPPPTDVCATGVPVPGVCDPLPTPPPTDPCATDVPIPGVCDPLPPTPGPLPSAPTLPPCIPWSPDHCIPDDPVDGQEEDLTDPIDDLIETVDVLTETCSDVAVCGAFPIECNDLLCQETPTEPASSDEIDAPAGYVDGPRDPSPDEDEGMELLPGGIPERRDLPMAGPNPWGECSFWAGGSEPWSRYRFTRPMRYRVRNWEDTAYIRYINFWVRADCSDNVASYGSGRVQLLGERLRAFGHWQDRIDVSMPLRDNGNRSINKDLHCNKHSPAAGTWTWRSRLILHYKTWQSNWKTAAYISEDKSRYECNYAE